MTDFARFHTDPSTILRESQYYRIEDLAALFGVEYFTMEEFPGAGRSAPPAEMFYESSL